MHKLAGIFTFVYVASSPGFTHVSLTLIFTLYTCILCTIMHTHMHSHNTTTIEAACWRSHRERGASCGWVQEAAWDNAREPDQQLREDAGAPREDEDAEGTLQTHRPSRGETWKRQGFLKCKKILVVIVFTKIMLTSANFRYSIVYSKWVDWLVCGGPWTPLGF